MSMLLVPLLTPALASIPRGTPAFDPLLEAVYVDGLPCPLVRGRALAEFGVLCPAVPALGRDACFHRLVASCGYASGGEDTGVDPPPWTATRVAVFATDGDPSELAVDDEQGVLLVPSYSGDEVGIYSLVTYEKIGAFAAEGGLSDVVVDPAAGRVWVGNRERVAYAFDRTTYALQATFTGPTQDFGFVVDPDLALVYILWHSAEASVVDDDTLEVIDTLSLTGAFRQSTYGDGTAWLLDQSGVVYAIDSATRTVTDSIRVDGSIYGEAYVSGADRLYISGFSAGEVYVVEASTMSLLGTLPVSGPFEMGVDPASGIVAVPAYGTDEVLFIDSATDTVVATAPTCSGATEAGFSETTGLWYVTCFWDHEVAVISLTAG